MFKMLLRARAAVQYMAVFLLLTLIGIVAFWWNSPNQMNQADSSQVAEYSHNLNQKQNLSRNSPSTSDESHRQAISNNSARESADQIVANLTRENLDKYGLETRDFSLMISQLSDSFVNLLTDDSGRQLANSESLVDKFLLYRQEFEPLRDQLSEIEQSPKWLEADLLRATSESRPDYQMVSQKVSEKRRQLSELITKCKNLQNSLTRIVSVSSNDSPGNMTLQQALDQRLSATEEKRLQVLKQKEKELEEKHAQELEALAIQKVQAEHDAEKQRQLDQIAQMKSQAEAEKTKAEIARKKRQLEVEFEGDWPQIQHYLGVLFKHSSRQIVGGNVVGVEEEGPVSLAGLRSLGKGALGNDYEKKLSGLLLFFSYDEAGGRGVGPYPARYLGSAITRDQEAAIRPAYLLLEKYGELLVEKKLLAP
jgi:hypothetical protein